VIAFFRFGTISGSISENVDARDAQGQTTEMVETGKA
jgi:hypothetical protein